MPQTDPSKNFFLNMCLAQGAKQNSDYEKYLLGQREQAVMERWALSLGWKCPQTGQEVAFKRCMRKTKKVANPKANDAVPFGAMAPAPQIEVPEDKYGRYYWMGTGEHYGPQTNWKGEPTGATEKDGSPKYNMYYEPLGQWGGAKAVDLDCVHPGIRAVLKDQFGPGPHQEVSMTEEQIVDLEQGAVWFNADGVFNVQ